MPKRKFYKTIIAIEVLSEDPYYPHSLKDVYYDISEGSNSGSWKVAKSEVLNGQQMAKALIDQGSDPEFFSIDKDGNDLEE